jgi:hypothetical protein
MAKKKPRSRSVGDAPGGSVSVAKTRDGGAWTLIHPREIRDCAEDLDEVRAMIDAGETDVAIDELRWLLGVCHDFIEAHYLLGKLAVEALEDLPLARGHFGVGFHLGEKALARAGYPAPLPALHPANRPFFDAGRGLAWCLNELGKDDPAKREQAVEVVERLLACDASDPLGLRSWIDDIRTGGAPIVELG